MDIFIFLKAKKPIALALILIIFFSLFANGILLHPKKAQAWLADAANYVLQVVKWTWEKVVWAYSKAKDTIVAAAAAWEKSIIILFMFFITKNRFKEK